MAAMRLALMTNTRFKTSCQCLSLKLWNPIFASYTTKNGISTVNRKITDEHYIADKMLLQKAQIINKISQKYRDFFSTKA